jgi:hypothetical protein
MIMHYRIRVPLAILAAFAAFTGLAARRPLAAAEPWPAVGAEPSAAEVKIHSALTKEAHFDFIETPLDQAVQFLKEAHQIPIELDKKALDQVGIGTDTPITRALKGIALESALRLLLRDLDLGFVVQDEVLLITSADEIRKSGARCEVRVYRTHGVLSEGETPEALAAALTETLASEPIPAARAVSMPAMMPGMMPGMPGVPGAGAPAGPGIAPGMGPGMRMPPAAPGAAAKEPLRIVPLRDLLIVRATAAQQEELSRLLGILAEAKPSGPKRPAPAPPAPQR